MASTLSDEKFQPSRRVTENPPYAFATISSKVQAMQAQGKDVIRLDIGNPDMPPAPHIIDTLAEQSQVSANHGYGGYTGIPALRAAMADYYQTRYGVTLDPNKEVLPLIGSKEGIANLHLAWLNPGDLALVPDPGYIAYVIGPSLAGGEAVLFPLTADKGWLPDFSTIPLAQAEKAKMIWLNYPNNPTGAVADLAFFEEAIAFCRKHSILLCHDNPYSDVTFDGYDPVNPLQVPGAKDVVIEFNSLSKTYNMAGWRVGMAVGNETAVQALGRIKTQIDSGTSFPIQHMAISAIHGEQDWLVERNRIYQERRDLVMDALSQMGLDIPAPKATFYIWFPAPTEYTDMEFHEKLLQEAHVSIAPGSIYGEQGNNWMRLSIGLSTTRLKEALGRMKQMVG
ncbi:MAG: LL-diaminopimelate aminotransferase [Chloroflexota bacterium]